MTTLNIQRVNQTKFLVKDGKKVVRTCKSFKEAMNVIISEDLIVLDNVNDFCNSELEDYDLSEFNEAA